MIGPIRSREVFRRFDRRAARRRSGPVTVLHVPVDDRDALPRPSVPAGVAYAISRRVGTAVQRNRLRRQLRAAFTEIDRDEGVRPGWYLVIVHPGAVGTPFSSLRSALRDSLSELRGAEK